MRIDKFKRTSFAGARLVAFALTLPWASNTCAQPAATAKSSPEQRAARAFEAARPNPLDLRAFLVRMPKGADLHYHLSGGVYAETIIRDAIQDKLCVDPVNHSFTTPQVAAPSGDAQPTCNKGEEPAADALTHQNFYDAMVDSLSMRSFVPFAGMSGHDHFFDTFGKFGNTGDRYTGEWLDEAVTRAASQNEQYMEFMFTPPWDNTKKILETRHWPDDPNLQQAMKQFRMELLAGGLQEDVAVATNAIDKAVSQQQAREHCGKPQKTPACKIKIGFLYQVLRGFPKERVFAQTLLGFEIASADPRFVGINFVMAEDGITSMADYALQMKMIGFLHGVYPKIHISLHAGEIAEGLVPPAGLCCHIRQAVEDAHAERIGHGVDVMHEDRPYELLKEMAAKHTMVEINLTSNDVILGVVGKDHPFPIYRRFRVPVALSTDDEGVSRIDLTHEYVRAVETYGLSYADLKQMVRTGLEHNFLRGESLWRERDNFARTAAACASDVPGDAKPKRTCAEFLDSSKKAKQQWELEHRFREFEASL